MHTLIDDLLDYSRVSTRGKPFKPTDCGALLDDVLANLRVAIEESGAAVTHDRLPTVMADDTQLARVFQSLVSNAIKFRQVAPPEVHVRTRREDDEWVFSVHDNGIGIDPQHSEHIFPLPAFVHAGGVSWHGDWSGDLQKDRGAARRPHLGGV